MLKRITFKNFKSFTSETTISFEETKSEILQSTNVYKGILKGCAFYGANASGKTNALNAITILFDMLFDNSPINIIPLITRFNNEPTMFFDYLFQIAGQEIDYRFDIDRKGRIAKEVLKLNDKVLLNRLTNSAESFITENRNYGKDDVDEKTLFLRNIYFNTKFANYPVLVEWFKFLTHSLYFNPMKMFNSLITFDKGNNDNNLQVYLDKHGDSEINKFFNEFGFPFTIKYQKASEPMPNFITFANRLSIERKNLPDIPFYLESYGTSLLLSILPSVLTIVKTGGILAVDEFSSGFHNDLEELLIKYINSHSTNCQFIFVSHSTNLLKTSLLRPDQIYAVDFGEHGSVVKRFSDEHPRESQNLEKMYLSGVFGGIPLYKNDNFGNETK